MDVDGQQRQSETEAQAFIKQNSSSEALSSGALRRIRSFMLAWATVATLAAMLMRGWRVGMGLLIGCALGYVNFEWLKSAVTAIADRITRTERTRGGARIVVRFLLRYVLLAAAAYVIFKISRASLHGFLTGIFLPVAAIITEAIYEAWAAVRGKL